MVKEKYINLLSKCCSQGYINLTIVNALTLFKILLFLIDSVFACLLVQIKPFSSVSL